MISTCVLSVRLDTLSTVPPHNTFASGEVSVDVSPSSSEALA